MSPSLFYREQAAQQKAAADAATLDNVRERCQRAADAWTALASRSERADSGRLEAAADKRPAGMGATMDRAFAADGIAGGEA